MRHKNFLAAVAAAAALLAPLPAGASTEPVVFEGAGWGHGVGMSQYGSFEMAKDGRTADQILSHYYKGTSTADYRQKLSGWLVDDPEPLWVHLATIPGQLRIEATASGLVVCQQEPDYVGLMRKETNRPELVPWILLLEERLAELGFAPGPVDGVFTSETEAAARAFQASKGLVVDGLVGDLTKNALWDGDGSDRCVVRTPLSGFTIFTPVGSGRECLVTGAIMAAGCTGSVRGANSDSRVRLPSKPVRSGSSIELAHGTLRIRPDRNQTTSAFQGLHAVVEIGIDDYALGIDETILGWGNAGGMEALKAQAIASRSYGVALARTRGPEPIFTPKVRDDCWCHLWSTSSSQVYAGWHAETASNAIWRSAATQTAGRIVTHPQAAVAQAFFSSSSGGKTEDNSAWSGGAQLPYLESVEDPWSLRTSNPFRTWQFQFGAEVVAAKVGLDELAGVGVVERNRSGTAKTVRFVGLKNGVTQAVDRKGTAVRSDFGLRSAYFDVSWGEVGGQGDGPTPDPAPGPQPPAEPRYPFSDIGTNRFVHDIVWLHSRGLTSGCNPPTNDRFCPDSMVNRGEMAVFLERALGLPKASADYFDDDNGKFYEEAANRIYEAGITSGCGTRKFCGDDSIPREQMAAFLARALKLGPAPHDFFVDDAGSMFQDEINRIAHVDVTRGCNPPANDRFCPKDFVTRGQLAAFLKRALD